MHEPERRRFPHRSQVGRLCSLIKQGNPRVWFDALIGHTQQRALRCFESAFPLPGVSTLLSRFSAGANQGRGVAHAAVTDADGHDYDPRHEGKRIIGARSGINGLFADAHPAAGDNTSSTAVDSHPHTSSSSASNNKTDKTETSQPIMHLMWGGDQECYSPMNSFEIASRTNSQREDAARLPPVQLPRLFTDRARSSQHCSVHNGYEPNDRKRSPLTQTSSNPSNDDRCAKDRNLIQSFQPTRTICKRNPENTVQELKAQSSPPPSVATTKSSRYLREMDRRVILSRIARGEKQSALAKEFHVSRAAICNLNKHREQALSRKDENPFAKHPKKPRRLAKQQQRPAVVCIE